MNKYHRIQIEDRAAGAVIFNTFGCKKKVKTLKI